MEKRKKIFNMKSIDCIDADENSIYTAEKHAEHHHKINAHIVGNLCLTITTIILVIICLFYDASFAPFIVLLMSSRIGASVYTVVKANSKKEVIKLVLWVAICFKSVLVCFQLVA